MMNIYDEMKKRGIESEHIMEDDKQWTYYKNLYDVLGCYKTENSLSPCDIRFAVSSAVDTYKLVQYAREHGEIEFLKKLGKCID